MRVRSVIVLLTALAARSATAQSAFAPAGVTAPSADSVVAPADTTPRRKKSVEVSDAYEIRLRIHRYASYTMLPLFAVQSVAGNQLFQADKSGAERPGWAQNVHSAGAAGLGALFTLNTVTGLWNLWESRDNEVGRTKRLLHSALLLASDAGFAWSGIKLASDARHDSDARNQHRNVAYYSMGAAAVGYGIMYFGNH